MLTRLLGGDDQGVIAAAVAGVPEPVGVAGDLVAGGQAVGAGLLGVEREGVLAGLAARAHGVSLVVVAVIPGDDRTAVRRHDAVFDAVAVGVEGGAVAAVEVGEDLSGCDARGIGGEQDGQGNRIAGGLVHEDMGGGVIGVEAVDGERGVAGGADRETEDGVGGAGIVIGELLLAVAAVPDADLVFDGGEGGQVGGRALPPHGIAGGAGVAFHVVEAQGGLPARCRWRLRASRRGWSRRWCNRRRRGRPSGKQGWSPCRCSRS